MVYTFYMNTNTRDTREDGEGLDDLEDFTNK